MSSDSDREPSMQLSVAALWRGRWFVLACAALAGAAGFAFAEKRGVIRRAKSTLHVERGEPAAPGGDAGRFHDVRGYANAQAALLKSAPTLQRAVDASAEATTQLFEDAEDRLAFLRKKLSVSVGAEDGLLAVSLDASDTDGACAMVNAVVDSYLARLAEAQRSSVAAALDALQTELQRREAEAQAVEAEQRRHLEAHPSLSLDAESRRAVASARLTELHAALAQAEVATLIANSDAAAARACAAAEDPLAAAPFPGMDDAQVRRLGEWLQRIDAAAASRERLMQTVTAEHPDSVRSAEFVTRERQSARDAVRAMAASAAASAEARAAASRRSAATLADRVAGEERRIADEEPLLAQARALDARLSRSRRVAEALHDRAQAVGVTLEADNASSWARSAYVYERATSASSAVVQGRGSVIAVAVFAGCAVGVAFVWMRAVARPMVFSAGDIAASGVRSFEFPRVDRPASFDEAPKLLLGAAHAAVAGMRSTPSVAASRVLCIAGIADDRATASIGSALAIAFAEQGERTLLCDPFGIGHPGESEAPKDGAQHGGNGVASARPVRAASTEGLWLLDDGSRSSFEGASWLGRAKGAVDSAAMRFDRVVVLAPAALRSVDAQLCAKACGSVLLVGELGRLRARDAEAAIAEFTATGVASIAIVLHGSRSLRANLAAPSRAATTARFEEAKAAPGRDGLAPSTRGKKPMEESA